MYNGLRSPLSALRSPLSALRSPLSKFRTVTFFLAIFLLSHATAAHAQQCTISNNLSNVEFGNLTIGRDIAIGQAISTLQRSTISVSCPSSPAGYYLQMFSQLRTSTTVSGVWETGTAGIGIRVIDESFGNGTLSGSSRGDFGPPTSTAANSATFRFSYQLIKTGSVSENSAIAVGRLFELRSHRIGVGQTSDAQAAIGINNSSVRAQSCTVTTTAIAVALPKVSAAQFSAIGTTAGSTPFSIGLTCQGSRNIHITLTDVATSTNRTNQLSLDSSSTASGVRLRILNASGTAIGFGPDSAAAGTQNQWLAGQFAPTVTIPLTVQYISTGTVRPGTVSARATFTMSYQ